MSNNSSGRVMSYVWLILSLVAGVCLGALGMFVGASRSPPKEFTDVVDVNSDGIPESFVIFKNGIVERAEHDRNSDGVIDLVEEYSDGAIATARGDDNFDGKMDSWWRYKGGYVEFSEFDTDWNGVADYFVYSHLGVNRVGVWRPNNGSEVLRVEIFEEGVKRKEYRSPNGDNNFNELVEFNSFEQPVSEVRLEKALTPKELIEKYTSKLN